jgi:hypothetical protein
MPRPQWAARDVHLQSLPLREAINRKLVRDTAELKTLGVHSVAIMSNDTEAYPEDSFENMQRVARDMGYPFPYLFDETQEVARAYGAVCTPDFFGYNADLELQYRGRLDASGRNPDSGEVERELFLAMKQVAETGCGPRQAGGVHRLLSQVAVPTYDIDERR